MDIVPTITKTATNSKLYNIYKQTITFKNTFEKYDLSYKIKWTLMLKDIYGK